MKKLSLVIAALSFLALGAMELKDKDSVAFLGDSITQYGWSRPAGYVRMCEQAFIANGLKIGIIPAGISGHKSNQMLARLEKDVLNKKPVWMVLSCGVNDVWHGARGVKLPEYRKNITAIVEKAQAAGVKVIIMTATMIREDENNALNKQLAGYNDFLRQLAKERKCTLVDLNAEMQKQVKTLRQQTGGKGNMLTLDGVHMNFEGDRMMATALLRDGFGFNAEQLGRFDKALLQMQHSIPLGSLTLNVGDYLKLKKIADSKKITVSALVSRLVSAEVAKQLGK